MKTSIVYHGESLRIFPFTAGGERTAKAVKLTVAGGCYRGNINHGVSRGNKNKGEMEMSAQEFDQMDEELMDMVNDHAAPEAVATAEEIVEREAVPKAVEPKQMPDENVATKRNYAPDRNEEVKRSRSMYQISEKEYRELEEKVEAATRRRTIAAVVVCALTAVALLMVLFQPSLLIWLVNAGVVSCSVVTGIAMDRWWRRK